MIVKVCSNTLCNVGKSATTFHIDESTCPYCNSILELRKPDFNLDDASLEKYEEYVNELIVNFEAQNITVEDLSKYYTFIGNEWFNRENWGKSLLYFQKTLQVLLISKGNHEKEIETLYNNLGSVYIEIGQPEQAVLCFSNCLNIQKKLFAKHDLLIGWTCNNLANAYFSLGNLDGAIDNYKEAVKICEISNENDYNSLITLFSSLGNAQLLKSDLNEAIFFLEKGLVLCHSFLEPSDPRIGLLLSKLGEAFARIGNFEKAVVCHQKELALSLNLFNSDDLTYVYWKLGFCYQQLGEYQLAIETYKEGFRESDNKSAGFPFNIGKCFEAQNKLDEALEYYFIASETRINDLGINAKETTEAVNEHNRLAIALGKTFLDINEYKPKR